MLGKLTLEMKQQGNTALLAVAGPIDEDAVFAGIDLPGACNELLIDLSKVSLLNSCGIRAWVKWIQSLPATLKIAFLGCPKIVVDQINNVDGFIPKGAEVRSFEVPYFCESCESMTVKVFSKGAEYGGASGAVAQAETMPCGKCGKDAELDVIGAKYFSFLKSA